MLTRVLAAGHAEAELKVKALEQPLSEVMSLDHPEVFDRQVSDRELHAGEERRGGRSERKDEREEGRKRGVTRSAGSFILTWLRLAAGGEKLG